jgi:hypothetical protein
MFKSYTTNPLLALGIRDSLLTKELTEQYLIVLFTTSKIVENTNSIISGYTHIEFDSGCYYLETNSEFMLLLTKDLDGLHSGNNLMEEILTQVLEDYFNRKNFDEYIKVPQFKIKSC